MLFEFVLDRIDTLLKKFLLLFGRNKYLNWINSAS